MERRMENIKVSVIIARGLAQWRSQAFIKTKIGQIHQLHSMYVPLMRRCCMGAHTGSHPILYGFWHAYKFGVTQTFRSFWPIVTFFRKGLLRSGDTVPCFPKLITMEITVGALLLGMGPGIRRLHRKCRSL